MQGTEKSQFQFPYLVWNYCVGVMSMSIVFLDKAIRSRIFKVSLFHHTVYLSVHCTFNNKLSFVALLSVDLLSWIIRHF